MFLVVSGSKHEMLRTNNKIWKWGRRKFRTEKNVGIGMGKMLPENMVFVLLFVVVADGVFGLPDMVQNGFSFFF